MANTISPSDNYYFAGGVRFRTAPTFPSGSIPSDSILGPIVASKLQGEFGLNISETGTVVATTQYLRVIRGATATILSIEAAITETVATGNDRTVSVDLQKSTGAAAFATVLAAPIVFNSASTARTLSQGSLSNASLIDGDLLRMVVTVAGSNGNQALGLMCTATINEDA